MYTVDNIIIKIVEGRREGGREEKGGREREGERGKEKEINIKYNNVVMEY